MSQPLVTNGHVSLSSGMAHGLCLCNAQCIYHRTWLMVVLEGLSC